MAVLWPGGLAASEEEESINIRAVTNIKGVCVALCGMNAAGGTGLAYPWTIVQAAGCMCNLPRTSASVAGSNQGLVAASGGELKCRQLQRHQYQALHERHSLHSHR